MFRTESQKAIEVQEAFASFHKPLILLPDSAYGLERKGDDLLGDEAWS